ncbi:MAG: ATP-binding protein [Kofleriaceae bacterium]
MSDSEYADQDNAATLHRLETATSLIHAVHGTLSLAELLHTTVENLVEVGGFASAAIELDGTIDNFAVRESARAGDATLPGLVEHVASLFVRGVVLGTLVTHADASVREPLNELLEFVLPTLYLSIDHAVSFAEVMDYRATLEQRVMDRTAELALAREDLERSLDEVREVKASRDRFFANINHEIRTPLTMIQLATDGISRARERLGPVESQHLEEVNAASRRLLHLVDSLLQLAAGDEGKLRIRPSNIDVAKSLQRLVASWVTAAGRAAVTINYRGPDACAATLDETALDTVVGNFISNAMKFTPRDGQITVTLADCGETVRIEVRDTGPGIDRDYIPKLFSRFERSRTAVEKGVRGTGIGLSLSKELVDLQGGSIDVQRHDEPSGTSFIVELPRNQKIVATDTPPSQRIVPYEDSMPVRDPSTLGMQPLGKPEATVLLAEDDEALSHHITQILGQHYRVITAPNGRIALELAAKHTPDILVTDLEMPEMNGLELTGRFLAQQGSSLAPVLIVSAHSRLAERLAGFEAGAVDYVMKPFSADELLARIRNQLQIRKLALKLHETQKLAAMGMLSSGLAHELRNPANALVNALEPFYNLLPSAQRGEESAGTALYQVMETAATQIRDLCANILQFSRSGDVMKSPQDLQTLVKRAMLVLKEKFDGVSLRVHADWVKPVPCSGPLIEQILINLLDNAAFAAGKNGTVTVTIRHDDSGKKPAVVVEVGDSGPGVPAELAERIFDPFFTTKPVGQGTGLGLSVSKRIALNHGGDLRVVRGDAGTVFRLELPL